METENAKETGYWNNICAQEKYTPPQYHQQHGGGSEQFLIVYGVGTIIIKVHSSLRDFGNLSHLSNTNNVKNALMHKTFLCDFTKVNLLMVREIA